MEKGLISVVIPVYNGRRYIAEAIKSVLNQGYGKREILIVNDGSTDGTENILRSFEGIMYFEQSRQGAAAARNLGIEQSRGEFLAFLDADDVWTNDKIEKQLSVFQEKPKLDMVFGNVEQFYSPELEESLSRKIKMIEAVIPGYVPGTMLIKKEAFLKVGYFNCGFKVGEFIDWYLRALEEGLQGHLLSDVVLRRRIHDANTGIQERDSRKDYLRVLKASLDRRRRDTQEQRNP